MEIKLFKFTKLVFLSAIVACIFAAAGLAQSNEYEGVVFSVILTDGKSDEGKTIFRVGDEIVIKTSLDNASSEPFPFYLTGSYYQYKFGLTFNDEILPVSYREDRAASLSIREEVDSGAGMRLLLDPIPPGKTQELNTLKLSDRYEPLSPGRYNLMIEYKSGKFVQVENKTTRLRLTQKITFEVVP